MLIILTTKAINVMAMIQSSQSPIEIADIAQRRVFVASVVFGVVAALIAAILAWLLWRANNKYQDAVIADANARIEEARRGAEEARKDAATANARAQELALRIEEESRKRAEAETQLERLRQRVFPRGLKSMGPLMEGPKGRAEVLYQSDLPEAYNFARNVYLCLLAAGWEVSRPAPIPADKSQPHLPSALAAGASDSDVTIRAFRLESEPETTNNPYSMLWRFFRESDLRVHGRQDDSLPLDLFRIVIGPR